VIWHLDGVAGAMSRGTASHSHISHLPAIGLDRVPDPKPAPKGPVERGAGVFVGFFFLVLKTTFWPPPAHRPSQNGR
jgi:hypothetical protein